MEGLGEGVSVFEGGGLFWRGAKNRKQGLSFSFFARVVYLLLLLFFFVFDLAFFAFATQSVIVTHSFCIHSFARFVLFVFLYFVCLFLFFFFTFIVFVLVFYFVRSFTSTLLSRFALVLLARSCRFAPVFVSAVCACACACVCHACTPGRLFCLFFLMFVCFFYFLFFNESADFAFVLLARL